MRVRKYPRNPGVTAGKAAKAEEQQAGPQDVTEQPENLPATIPKKTAAARGPAAFFRKVMENPSFNIQLMVILLTLASENFSMDRRIDSMTSTVDKIRNVTDVINSTMQSVKVATDAPKQIRRLFETNKN
ncbi:hypothetical protein [Sporomusa termitida]|uniref:Uncharacterized protein n=1 Tax=Sporomusa termitida TaxID=2377 RepID=A0A517DU43_9FIRM|nr:hypothetical protein [Sporomusa termitida]QDR80875.1 hypothetical protein SPTER_22130 [Sporomusa termitida]